MNSTLFCHLMDSPLKQAIRPVFLIFFVAGVSFVLKAPCVLCVNIVMVCGCFEKEKKKVKQSGTEQT